MHIGIGRSTSAFMIADPLAVLEEGEIHLKFSNVFEDPNHGRSDTELHGIDLLVARRCYRLTFRRSVSLCGSLPTIECSLTP